MKINSTGSCHAFSFNRDFDYRRGDPGDGLDGASVGKRG